MQSNTSERIESTVRETRPGPLGQSKRSVSKTRVTQISVDGSDAYETAQEETGDIAKEKDASLAEKDNPQALEREETLQIVQEAVN